MSDAPERYRPLVHFSPPSNFVNDPNGCLYVDGVWHLFYQHNPFGDTWGHMSWGHATSRDLVRWEHHPVAIPEADGVMAFSGSAVWDRENTSGLGEGGEGPLVAVYTGHAPETERQDQRLAVSTDRGRTWTPYAGNPVLDRGGVHFRDPKVFWHRPSGRWVMVVLRAVDRVAQFYGSPDLRTWTLMSEFGEAGDPAYPRYGAPDTMNWECPDLFELPVDGGPGEEAPRETRWVLKIDVGSNAVAGGSGGQYFVGTFDGERFTSDHPPETVLWVDHGPDFYAAQSWNDAPDGRRVWVGWMNDWRYANTLPTAPWRGQMTLPRELALVGTPEGVRLRQRPVPELDALRSAAWVRSDWTVGEGAHRLDSMPGGAASEVAVVFGRGEATRFGLRVREGRGEATEVGYDAVTGQVYVDRRHAGEGAFHEAFPAVYSAPLRPAPDGDIRLRVIVDACSVEVFANDGEAVLTALVFPNSESRGASLFSEGGGVLVRSVEAYALRV
jgi:fructan beta-fructosidase